MRARRLAEARIKTVGWGRIRVREPEQGRRERSHERDGRHPGTSVAPTRADRLRRSLFPAAGPSTLITAIPAPCGNSLRLYPLMLGRSGMLVALAACLFALAGCGGASHRNRRQVLEVLLQRPISADADPAVPPPGGLFEPTYRTLYMATRNPRQPYIPDLATGPRASRRTVGRSPSICAPACASARRSTARSWPMTSATGLSAACIRAWEVRSGRSTSPTSSARARSRRGGRVG